MSINRFKTFPEKAWKLLRCLEPSWSWSNFFMDNLCRVYRTFLFVLLFIFVSEMVHDLNFWSQLVKLSIFSLKSQLNFQVLHFKSSFCWVTLANLKIRESKPILFFNVTCILRIWYPVTLRFLFNSHRKLLDLFLWVLSLYCLSGV